MADPYGDNTDYRLNLSYWTFQDDKSQSQPTENVEKQTKKPDLKPTMSRRRARGGRNSDTHEQNGEQTRMRDEKQNDLNELTDSRRSRRSDQFQPKVREFSEQGKSNERLSELNQIKKIRIRRRTTECTPNQEEEGAEIWREKEEEKKKESALIKKTRRRRRTIECNAYLEDTEVGPEDRAAILRELKEIKRMRNSRRLEYNPYRNLENEEGNGKESDISRELDQIKKMRNERRANDRTSVDEKEKVKEEPRLEERRKELKEVKKIRRRSRKIEFDRNDLVKMKLASATRGVEEVKEGEANCLDPRETPDNDKQKGQGAETLKRGNGTELPQIDLLNDSFEPKCPQNETTDVQADPKKEDSEATQESNPKIDDEESIQKRFNKKVEKMFDFESAAVKGVEEEKSTNKTQKEGKQQPDRMPESKLVAEDENGTFERQEDSGELEIEQVADKSSTEAKKRGKHRLESEYRSVSPETKLNMDISIYPEEKQKSEPKTEDMVPDKKDPKEDIAFADEHEHAPIRTDEGEVTTTHRQAESGNDDDTGSVQKTVAEEELVQFWQEHIVNDYNIKKEQGAASSAKLTDKDRAAAIQQEENKDKSIKTPEKDGVRSLTSGKEIPEITTIAEIQSQPDKVPCESKYTSVMEMRTICTRNDIYPDVRMYQGPVLNLVEVFRENKGSTTGYTQKQFMDCIENSEQAHCKIQHVKHTKEDDISAWQTLLEAKEEIETIADFSTEKSEKGELVAKPSILATRKAEVEETNANGKDFTFLEITNTCRAKTWKPTEVGTIKFSEQLSPRLSKKSSDLFRKTEMNVNVRGRHSGVREQRVINIKDDLGFISESLTDHAARGTSLVDKVVVCETIQYTKSELVPVGSLKYLATETVDKHPPTAGQPNQNQRQKDEKLVHMTKKGTNCNISERGSLAQSVTDASKENETPKTQHDGPSRGTSVDKKLNTSVLGNEDIIKEQSLEDSSCILEKKVRFAIDGQEGQTPKDIFQDALSDLSDESRGSVKDTEYLSCGKDAAVQLADFLTAEDGKMAEMLQKEATKFEEHPESTPQQNKPSKDIGVVRPYVADKPMTSANNARDEVKKRNRKLDIIIGISVFMIYAVSLAVYIFYDHLFPAPEPEPEPEVNPFWKFIEILINLYQRMLL